MAYLPFCDLPWQSCSGVIAASLGSGIMVLLPFGEELTAVVGSALLRNYIDFGCTADLFPTV